MLQYIEIKGALEQRLVAGELKSLYEVALSEIGLPAQRPLYPIPVPDTSSSAKSPYITGFHGTWTRRDESAMGAVITCMTWVLLPSQARSSTSTSGRCA